MRLYQVLHPEFRDVFECEAHDEKEAAKVLYETLVEPEVYTPFVNPTGECELSDDEFDPEEDYCNCPDCLDLVTKFQETTTRFAVKALNDDVWSLIQVSAFSPENFFSNEIFYLPSDRGFSEMLETHNVTQFKESLVA